MDFANVEIDCGETPEKFQPMKEILVPQLLKLLTELSRLEEATFERGEKIKAEKINNGIFLNESTPEELELLAEYKEQYQALIQPLCTDKLLERRSAGSYGRPTQYGYVRSGCKLSFIMKNAKKATIEIHYNYARNMGKKHQFIMINQEDEWKIDSVKYGYAGKNSWLVQGI